MQFSSLSDSACSLPKQIRNKKGISCRFISKATFFQDDMEQIAVLKLKIWIILFWNWSDSIRICSAPQIGLIREFPKDRMKQWPLQCRPGLQRLSWLLHVWLHCQGSFINVWQVPGDSPESGRRLFLQSWQWAPWCFQLWSQAWHWRPPLWDLPHRALCKKVKIMILSLKRGQEAPVWHFIPVKPEYWRPFSIRVFTSCRIYVITFCNLSFYSSSQPELNSLLLFFPGCEGYHAPLATPSRFPQKAVCVHEGGKHSDHVQLCAFCPVRCRDVVAQTHFNCGSTTVVLSALLPILQVLVGWYTVNTSLRIKHLQYSSVSYWCCSQKGECGLCTSLTPKSWNAAVSMYFCCWRIAASNIEAVSPVFSFPR